MPRRRQKDSAKKRVGIYIRVSTEDQAKGESPEHHEKRARYYAESKEWEVVTVYHLEGVSGKSVLSHPEAQRMLSDVRSGRISALIFSKIARLARNTRELLDLADEFEKHGADLVSLQESIDTSTPAGRLFYTVIAALAEWERSEIATRVAASVPIRAKLGKSLGGAAPFGYRWVDKMLLVDEKEAPIRRLIFDLFAKHKKKLVVARLINEAGHRTRSGAKFFPSGIERLITDPIAKGTRRMNYRQSPENSGAFKDPSSWIYVDAPAIVSEEQWETCNQIIRSQKVPGAAPAKGPGHLFTGLVHCHCGTKMYVLTNGKSYVCKDCRNKIAEEDLEVVFVEQIKELVLSEDKQRDRLERTDEAISAKLDLLSTLETERSSVASEMEKVYRLYIADRISDQLFAERNGPLEERYRQLEDEIPRLQAELDLLRIQLHSSDEILSEAKDLYSRWPSLPFDARRVVVETITDRILVEDNEITIQFQSFTTQPHPTLEDGANTYRTLRDSSRRRG